jgi:hypothetical protein
MMRRVYGKRLVEVVKETKEIGEEKGRKKKRG